MQRIIIARLFAVICFLAGCFFIAVTIENWDSYTLLRKLLRIFACFGWMCIVYEAYTLRFSWLRNFVKQKDK